VQDAELGDRDESELKMTLRDFHVEERWSPNRPIKHVGVDLDSSVFPAIGRPLWARL